MSLINDALRRAKEAQLQAPPSALPGPQLRPIEPTQAARHSVGLLLPAGLAVVALCGLFFLWQLWRNNGSGSPPGAPAPTPPTAAVTPPPPPAQPPVEARPVTAVVPTEPASPPPPQTTASNTAASATLASPAAAVSPTQETAMTNPPAASPPPSPAPPPLKLQGIVFNPANPSATINGRTVFIGERLGAFRVLAIGKDSATLIGAGQTNVLSLP